MLDNASAFCNHADACMLNITCQTRMVSMPSLIVWDDYKAYWKILFLSEAILWLIHWTSYTKHGRSFWIQPLHIYILSIAIAAPRVDHIVIQNNTRIWNESVMSMMFIHRLTGLTLHLSVHSFRLGEYSGAIILVLFASRMKEEGAEKWVSKWLSLLIRRAHSNSQMLSCASTAAFN